MARKDIPKAEVDAPPRPTPPRNRDEIVTENRQREKMGDPADVRAGPGDAGAQKKPDRLDPMPGQKSRGWGRGSAIVGLVLVVVLGLAILL